MNVTTNRRRVIAKLALLFGSFCFFLSCSDDRTSSQIMTEVVKYMDDDDYELAFKEVSSLVETDRNNPYAFILKGRIEMKLGNNGEALNSFRRAIELDTMNYEALVDRAKLKIELGDYKSAILDCESAKFIRKDFEEIYRTKGVAYELLNDLPNAIAGYENAIKYGDNIGDTRFRLGILLLNLGRKEEACIWLSKAGELGFMDAYPLIKSNCNKGGSHYSEKSGAGGQFKSFPGRFSVTFPDSWKVEEVSNTTNSLLIISATHGDDFFSIVEDPITPLQGNKVASVWDLSEDFFLDDYRNTHENFELLSFEQTKVNGVDAYLYSISSSFFSKKLQPTLSGITVQCVLLKPETKTLYYLTGSLKKNNFGNGESEVREIIKSFQFR